MTGKFTDFGDVRSRGSAHGCHGMPVPDASWLVAGVARVQRTRRPLYTVRPITSVVWLYIADIAAPSNV